MAANAVGNYYVTDTWWLNTWILPGNLDAVLNQIGILIISGFGIREEKIRKMVEKYFPESDGGVTVNNTAAASSGIDFNSSKVTPKLSAGIDSHAYDSSSEERKSSSLDGPPLA
jgi:hypothetical protein